MFYAPKLPKSLISYYMGLTPFWSGIGLKGCKKLRDTNASAENWMRVVKNEILPETYDNISRKKNKVLSAAEFIVEMHSSLTSR